MENLLEKVELAEEKVEEIKTFGVLTEQLEEIQDILFDIKELLK